LGKLPKILEKMSIFLSLIGWFRNSTNITKNYRKIKEHYNQVGANIKK